MTLCQISDIDQKTKSHSGYLLSMLILLEVMTNNYMLWLKFEISGYDQKLL